MIVAPFFKTTWEFPMAPNVNISQQELHPDKVIQMIPPRTTCLPKHNLCKRFLAAGVHTTSKTLSSVSMPTQIGNVI